MICGLQVHFELVICLCAHCLFGCWDYLCGIVLCEHYYKALTVWLWEQKITRETLEILQSGSTGSQLLQTLYEFQDLIQSGMGHQILHLSLLI